MQFLQMNPLNLLQKLSLQKETVGNWRELVESIMIDFNYDGGVFEPTLLDIPEKDKLVSGEYDIPVDAGTIRIKITDLLSESLEMEVNWYAKKDSQSSWAGSVLSVSVWVLYPKQKENMVFVYSA